jgi:Ca-activated chloride channel family protein
MRRFLCVLLLLVSSSALVLAAEGRIVGTVTDQSGAALPGVTVTLHSRALTRTNTTDAQGRFAFSVPPGRYTVSAQLTGFANSQIEVTVTTAQTVTPAIVMLVGTVSETVTVTATTTRSGMQAGMAISGHHLRQSAPRNTESYARIDESPFLDVRSRPLSTFSIDVDTASYANVRRFLTGDQLPPKDAVRIEELVNYFNYEYPDAGTEHPFGVTTEIADCPWAPAHRLALVGLQARTIAPTQVPARNLVFLVDVSGSMEDENKLPLVKSALRLLVPQLTERDRIALVVYAGSSGLVLDATPGDRHEAVLDALDRLEAGGSTNGAEGIQLAYNVAARNRIDGGINRVILCTDGDFNVGVSDEGSLTRLVEKEKERGVFLSVLGFGMGNLKDSMMEKLADRGDGNYAYIDSPAEARKVLGAEAAGTLLTVAKDVKLQVEFNPRLVSSYRLIGYENRRLEDEDFDDDAKDAGELGAGQSVTALYELVPAGAEPAARPGVELKYQEKRRPSADSRNAEWMTVNIRYKPASGGRSRRFSVATAAPAGAEASENLRFASAVAAFGMLLRDSAHKGTATFEMVDALARSALTVDGAGYRAEFVSLAARAEELAKEVRAAQR